MVTNNREKKFARRLARAIADESAHIRKYRLLGGLTGIGGWLIAGLTFLVAKDHGSLFSAWLVVFGVLGGILIGVSLLYSSVPTNWPIMRKFIDKEVVTEIARDSTP